MAAHNTARPPMDTDEEQALLDGIQKWMDKEVRPVIMHHDHNDIWPAELVAQMADMGLFGATIGEEYGGLGLSSSTYAKIVMLMSSYWMAITRIFNSHLIMAAAVERFGTAQQKTKWLPKFASGEIRGGLALTEPNAGTDLQSIRSVAVRDGDDYVINGTKTWISNSVNGSCFAMLVKTDPKAEPRYQGMSFFIAPKGEGLSVGKKFDKLGYKSIDSAELVMEDYRLPADNLLGGEAFYESRKGFKASMATFNMTRPLHTAHGVGMGRAAHDFALDFVRNEYPNHGPRRQRALERLARIRRGLQTARLMYLNAVWLAKNGHSNVLEASYAKMYSPPVILDAVATALDILGEAGVRNDQMLEKLYRDVKILDIGEGTQQVQRVVVARQLFDFPRDK